MRLVSALVTVAGMLAIPAVVSADAPIFGQIAIPATALDLPDRVFVLPVFVVPSNREEFAPPWVIGEPDLITHMERWDQAKDNLRAHLRVAREKYRQMLRTPGGQDRGTFELATWNAAADAAALYAPGWNTLEPLVVHSSWGYYNLKGNAKEMLSQVMDEVGCHQQSCPFVFVIVLVGSEAETLKIGGTAVNYGFNGGAARIIFPYQYVVESNSTREEGIQDPSVRGSLMQSSLLHELGHAFGLSHPDDVYDTTPFIPDSTDAFSYAVGCSYIPAEQRRYEHYCSDSVMSYNKLLWSNGCVATDADGHCAFPADPTQIASQVAGAFIPDDLQKLAINRRVFPDLWFDRATDSPYPDLKWYGGPGGVDLPAQASLRVITTYGVGEHRILGVESNTIAPAWAPYDSTYMWRSQYAIDWVPLEVYFPEPVDLSRLRLYTGSDGGYRRADAVQVTSRLGAPGAYTYVNCGEAPLTGTDDDFHLDGGCGPSSTYFIYLHHETSLVTVRGIRLFAEDGSELFPPREPRGSSSFTATAWGGGPDRITGSDHVVLPLSHAFAAEHQWHSKQVTPGNWVSIDVTFPDQVTLGGVKVHSGHSTDEHVATQVQVERRLGDGSFDYLTRTAVGSSSLVAFSAAAGTTWRIALRTGPSGYVVVRGLRFFDDQGRELYPARSVPTGE